MTITLDAPIKINLALHVIRQEANGYHQLQTLVAFAQSGDRISVATSTEDKVYIDGPYVHNLSTGQDNLIVKARDLLRDYAGKTSSPVCLKLTKKLPPASGLGGGSADAAATLLALVHAWKIEVKDTLLYELAQKIGADVPMCLHALQHKQAVLATGIGDKIMPLPWFPPLDMVIINPLKALSTAAVFNILTEKNNPPFVLPTLASVSIQSLVQALKHMRNDLMPPACHLMPEIRKMIHNLEQNGALLARMSGSGASCFGIYANREQTCQAVSALRRQHPDYFIQNIHTMGKESDADPT